LLGLVLWSFFAEVTGGSVGSIVGKGDLLRKLNFPRYVLVLSPSFSAFINMIINLGVVVVFMIVGGVQVGWEIIFVPFLIIELFAFAIAIGFFLAATYVKLRDIGYVWDVVMQILFYATPIFFPITLAPIWAQKIIMLNPLAQTIQDMRYLMISPDTTTITDVYNGNPYIRLVPITITIVMLIVFGLYFKKRSKYFAEEI
jgi:ABC-2 type transport system permease protein